MTLTTDAQASLDRVLDRLASGEKLSQHGLKSGDRFCIMGLFIDESRLGRWTKQSFDRMSGYIIDPNPHAVFAFPAQAVADYYGLTGVSGIFNLCDIPIEIYEELRSIYGVGGREFDTESLTNINDILIPRGYSVEMVNRILADIIKSGAIFKKEGDTNDDYANGNNRTELPEYEGDDWILHAVGS